MRDGNTLGHYFYNLGTLVTNHKVGQHRIGTCRVEKVNDRHSGTRSMNWSNTASKGSIFHHYHYQEWSILTTLKIYFIKCLRTFVNLVTVPVVTRKKHPGPQFSGSLREVWQVRGDLVRDGTVCLPCMDKETRKDEGSLVNRQLLGKSVNGKYTTFELSLRGDLVETQIR